MADMCGDNRFEIIAKAKADLLEGTNIETDEAEMAVIDNILFRCWQMGWLDRYDRKDEPSSSEKPNNCKVKNYCDDCLYADTCDSKEFFYACTSKATISKMEQVDEPTTQTETQNSNLTFEKDECAKEYEELGLKELKELIEADRKTENGSEKPNNSKEGEL